MQANNIFSAYLCFEQLPDEVRTRHKIKAGAVAKVPRYDLVKMAGYCKALSALTNNKGMAVFYLVETRGRINSPDSRRADRNLQGKNSLNVSSVYLLDCEPKGGRLVGYGNPPRDKTFSKDKRPNPFYDSRNDGFIFLISDEWKRIELLIIPNGYNTVLGNAKALQDGVYDEALETMRKAATPFFEY